MSFNLFLNSTIKRDFIDILNMLNFKINIKSVLYLKSMTDYGLSSLLFNTLVTTSTFKSDELFIFM